MLKARVITALILVAGFLSALFFLPAMGWAGFAVLVALLAGWEWGGLARFSPSGRLVFAAVTGALCLGLIVLEAQSGPKQPAMLAYGLSALFWLIGAPLWMATKAKIGSAVLACLVGWLLLLPACLALVELRALSPLFLLAVMASVWVADIAAYFTGRAFGRHKLAPSISPGKTWEGAAGALVGVLVYGIGLYLAFGQSLATHLPLPIFALLLVLLTAVSIVGDLFESLMKRQAGIKDSSNLLPGHGGVLDRIDSLTSTLPLVGLILLLWQ